VGSGERSRSLPWFALAVLALGSLMAGCGAAGSAAQAGHVVTHDGARRSPAALTATARSGGLTVTLTATPTRAKAGSLVALNLTAYSFYAFPADPREQLAHAIRAVFDSWQGERALAYRRTNHIPDEWGRWCAWAPGSDATAGRS
jgi:hypothetical protein